MRRRNAELTESSQRGALHTHTLSTLPQQQQQGCPGTFSPPAGKLGFNEDSSLPARRADGHFHPHALRDSQ